MKTSSLPRAVAILGFARSGRSLARALRDRGVAASIGDAKPETEFPDAADWREKGIRLFLGGPPSMDEFLEGADWLVLSPGVPVAGSVPREARRRGLEVLAELEVAFRLLQAEVSGQNHWIAVTGTNGKSTTTSWIAEILRRAGRDVALAGNIGTPLSDYLDRSSPREFVCEVSSFQLETIDRFHPNVAVLTNVTPDHLDRYETFSDYVLAKQRIFRNLTSRDFAVINADDPTSVGSGGRARPVPFSRQRPVDGGVWVEDGWICSAARGSARRVLQADALSLSGAHNLENALAALAAADCAGASEEAIRQGLTTFRGLPHRTELVAERDGVRWIDDSKGTNVDATKKSLEGYPPGSVILILGGRDKHGDFSALAQAVRRSARQVLTIGEAAETIERAVAGMVPVERCETMVRAVARARELARAGDTVLLSPACASFDQFRDFEDRGERFAALARAASAAGVSDGT
ncbi:MAG TPA: UDP-N-acetylmuramoyl-L-alanine--D-glutamate ligase [Thermoanaerobaculia bacterium]